MFILKGSLEQIQEKVEAIKDQVKDAVVKISFTGEEKEYRNFAALEDQLQDVLEKHGSAKLVRCEKHMVNTAQKLRANALKVEIESKADLGWTDISDIMDKSIESSISQADERAEILKEARDIQVTVDKRMAI